MFNKLKHLKDLRSQAKTMQNALAQESETVQKGGVTIVMNGNMEITKMTIANDLQGAKLEMAVKDCANDAIKRVQRLMAKKMQEMGGLSGMGM